MSKGRESGVRRWSISGRAVSKQPTIKTRTPRGVLNTFKKTQRWLASEAVLEAVSRDDVFCARTFQAELDTLLAWSTAKLPQATVDSMHDYLFETEPVYSRSAIEERLDVIVRDEGYENLEEMIDEKFRRPSWLYRELFENGKDA